MQSAVATRGEYLKAAGAQLLTALPREVRLALRHAEVAVVLEKFTLPHWMRARTDEGGCCVQRSYVVAVVTDWALMLLAPHLPASRGSSPAPRVLLELPLLLLQDVVRPLHHNSNQTSRMNRLLNKKRTTACVQLADGMVHAARPSDRRRKPSP